MNDAIEIPKEDEELPVDPPIIDFLYMNEESGSYMITFIPEDRVSQQEKEFVAVPANSVDGRRVKVLLHQIEKVLGGNISRLSHAGDGDFGFVFTDGRQIQLSDAGGSAANSQEIFIWLQGLGMTAQTAFLANQLLKNQVG